MAEQANEAVTLILVGDVMIDKRPRSEDVEAVSPRFPRPNLVVANIDAAVVDCWCHDITLNNNRPKRIFMTNHLASRVLATEETRWKRKS